MNRVQIDADLNVERSLGRLLELLRVEYPAADVRVDRFPSGNVWVDVRLRGELVTAVLKRGYAGLSTSVGVNDPLDGFGEEAQAWFVNDPTFLAAAKRLLGQAADPTACDKRCLSPTPPPVAP